MFFRNPQQRKQQGFLLIILTALLVLASSSFVALQLAQLKQQAEKDEDRLQEQLHQARVALFWQAATKAQDISWQDWLGATEQEQWLQELGLLDLQAAIAVEPLRLQLQLATHQQAQKLAGKLAYSEVVGAQLSLRVPEYGIEQPWLLREYELTMATDLAGGGHDLRQVGKLMGSELNLNTVQVQHKAELSEVNSQEARFQRGDIQSLLSQRIQGESGQSDTLQAKKGQVTQSQSEMTQVESFSFGQADVAQIQSENLTSAALQGQRVKVERTLHLQGQAGQVFSNFHSKLDTLEQALGHCLYETLWCLAPVAPHFQLLCQGCEQEQGNSYFVARLSIQVAECRHGCGLRLQLPPEVTASCTEVFIKAGTAGTLECQLSQELAEKTELHFTVGVEVYSGKNAQVLSTARQEVSWRVLRQNCQAQEHLVDVMDAFPTTKYTFYLPAAFNNQTYSWQENRILNCDLQNRRAILYCSIFATCSALGEWRGINAECLCRSEI